MYKHFYLSPTWNQYRPQYFGIGLIVAQFFALICINITSAPPVVLPFEIEVDMAPTQMVPATVWPTRKLEVPPPKPPKKSLAPVVDIKTVAEDLAPADDLPSPPDPTPSDAELSPSPPTPSPPPLPPAPPEEAPIETVIRAERMPVFADCMADTEAARTACTERALLAYVLGHVRYPTYAREANAQGTVVARFVIDEKGRVSDVKVLRDIGFGCGKEVLRVLESLPDWLPGKQNGRPVRVQYTIPVKFKI